MTNKYKILRIGSYPTEIYNTIGMHTRWLNKHEEFETTHITPYFPGKTLNALGKTDIIK